MVAEMATVFGMFETLILILYLLASKPNHSVLGSQSVVLASRSFSLDDRYNNEFVNQVFKDNILLAISYMRGTTKNKADISWPDVELPFHYEFTLKPGQEFAFHDAVLPQYSKSLVKTMDAHFTYDEGFKYDGDITGDGVCHLASLIYWAAKDAGLNAYAPSNHNFAKINDVPKEYGVAIMAPSPLGNLYITNSFERPITFSFDYKNDILSVTVSEGGNISG